jgi:hypothetical protein
MEASKRIRSSCHWETLHRHLAFRVVVGWWWWWFCERDREGVFNLPIGVIATSEQSRFHAACSGRLSGERDDLWRSEQSKRESEGEENQGGRGGECGLYDG